jgi:hypothetical protein
LAKYLLLSAKYLATYIGQFGWSGIVTVLFQTTCEYVRAGSTFIPKTTPEGA